jgi:hypothetical protein
MHSRRSGGSRQPRAMSRSPCSPVATDFSRQSQEVCRRGKRPWCSRYHGSRRAPAASRCGKRAPSSWLGPADTNQHPVCRRRTGRGPNRRRNKDIAPLIDCKYVWDKPGEQGVLRGKGSAKPQNEGCNFLSDLHIDEADLREIEMIRASAPSTSLGVQETRMAN